MDFVFGDLSKPFDDFSTKLSLSYWFVGIFVYSGEYSLLVLSIIYICDLSFQYLCGIIWWTEVLNIKEFELMFYFLYD